MSGEDVIGGILIAFLVIVGLFLLPGIVWLIWQCLCAIVHFVLGLFAAFGMLYDLFLDAFPVLLIFVLPACFVFLHDDK